eukprot:TRINITY_DN1219_c0_g2_i4.p1 TRINITY_DN1219_c0_g2~~TRINITY_DN1219_c0_g2_i4.p1  ORF type:complete len:199 (+),score=36.16 TRINITY_DN1219_c0_g2_i4:130-726(+)
MAFFQSIEIRPVKEQEIQDKLVDFFRGHLKPGFKTDLIDDKFYIEPEDADEIDTLMDLNLNQDAFFATKGLLVEFKQESINVIKSGNNQDVKEPLLEQHEEVESSIYMPPKKIEKKEVVAQNEPITQVAPEAPVHHAEGKNTEDDIMGALQSTPFSARKEAPEEFFTMYSDSMIVVPLFLLYLFIIVLTQTIGSLFSQ